MVFLRYKLNLTIPSFFYIRICYGIFKFVLLEISFFCKRKLKTVFYPKIFPALFKQLSLKTFDFSGTKQGESKIRTGGKENKKQILTY